MGHRWKSLFTGVNSLRAGWVNDVTDQENEILKEYCLSTPLLLLSKLTELWSFFTNNLFLVNQLYVENHDLQVRNRWGQDDIAIWDEYVFPSYLIVNKA
jgi:hypothetical protein